MAVGGQSLQAVLISLSFSFKPRPALIQLSEEREKTIFAQNSARPVQVEAPQGGGVFRQLFLPGRYDLLKRLSPDRERVLKRNSPGQFYLSENNLLQQPDRDKCPGAGTMVHIPVPALKIVPAPALGGAHGSAAGHTPYLPGEDASLAGGERPGTLQKQRLHPIPQRAVNNGLVGLLL